MTKNKLNLFILTTNLNDFNKLIDSLNVDRRIRINGIYCSNFMGMMDLNQNLNALSVLHN